MPRRNYVHLRYPLSLRKVEALLFELGIDIYQETGPVSWNRFGPMLAGGIRGQRASQRCGFQHRCLHLDEICVTMGGETGSGTMDDEVMVPSTATKICDKVSSRVTMSTA